MIHIKHNSVIVDTVIYDRIALMQSMNRHLLITDNILSDVAKVIDLKDEDSNREDLMIIGIKDVIQQRLYAKGGFSVRRGLFVNSADCENIRYLENIVDNKDEIILVKQKARDKIEELKKQKFDGQMEFNQNGEIQENITEEEFLSDLLEDAV